MDAPRAFAAVLGLACAVALGYTTGIDHAAAQDLSKEEAFRFGYRMAECNDGELFRPIANMTADCQADLLAFCRDHPETYDPKDCAEAA